MHVQWIWIKRKAEKNDIFLRVQSHFKRVSQVVGQYTFKESNVDRGQTKIQLNTPTILESGFLSVPISQKPDRVLNAS